MKKWQVKTVKDKSNNALARDIKEIVPQDIVKIESATPVSITMEDGSTFVAHRFDFISEYEAEMIKQVEND